MEQGAAHALESAFVLNQLRYGGHFQREQIVAESPAI